MLCTCRTAQRRSRCIALPFHDQSTRRGREGSVTPRPLFTPGKCPVPIVKEAGWSPGPVWTGAKNLAPTGIRNPDRPTGSQSLYRLNYPGPHFQLLRHSKYVLLILAMIHITYYFGTARSYSYVNAT